MQEILQMAPADAEGLRCFPLVSSILSEGSAEETALKRRIGKAPRHPWLEGGSGLLLREDQLLDVCDGDI